MSKAKQTTLFQSWGGKSQAHSSTDNHGEQNRGPQKCDPLNDLDLDDDALLALAMERSMQDIQKVPHPENTAANPNSSAMVKHLPKKSSARPKVSNNATTGKSNLFSSLGRSKSPSTVSLVTDDNEEEWEPIDLSDFPGTQAMQMSEAAMDDSIDLSKVENLPGFDKFAGRMWIYPTNYPVRKYQLNIVEESLFKNTMVTLPTGLGKTFIAAVVMYNYYRWYPGGKVIFMAPTKPLVAQQIEACYNIMGIPQEDTAEMTGAMPPSERKKAWLKQRVFFLTPQVLTNDLSRSACPASQVKCVVVDEAHKALGNHAYCQVIRELIKQNEQFRVLALSATPGSDIKAVQTVLTNLLISHVELRTEESPDIQPYQHERRVDKIVVPLGEELQAVQEKYLQVLNVVVMRLKRQGVLYNKDTKSLSKFMVLKSREAFRQNPPDNLPRQQYGAIEGDFAMCMSLYHGYELLQLHGLRPLHSFLESTVSGDKGYGRQRTELMRNADFCGILELLRSKFETVKNPDLNHSFSAPRASQQQVPFVVGHPKMAKLEEIVLEHYSTFQTSTSATGEGTTDPASGTRIMIFSQYRDSVNEITEMLHRHRPLVKVMSFIGQSSAGKSSKGFTQKEQLKVMKMFREGGYNTLVATCVGEEGLDIGDVDLIICFDAHKSPIRLVQRMGRTGRKRGGRIVMLVTQGKEEIVYNQSQYSKKSIHKAILNGKKSLNYYPNNPRMVPDGLDPKCHHMHINVQTTFEPPNKSGVKKGLKSKTTNVSAPSAIGVAPKRGRKRKGVSDQEQDTMPPPKPIRKRASKKSAVDNPPDEDTSRDSSEHIEPKRRRRSELLPDMDTGIKSLSDDDELPIFNPQMVDCEPADVMFNEDLCTNGDIHRGDSPDSHVVDVNQQSSAISKSFPKAKPQKGKSHKKSADLSDPKTTVDGDGEKNVAKHNNGEKGVMKRKVRKRKSKEQKSEELCLPEILPEKDYEDDFVTVENVCNIEQDHNNSEKCITATKGDVNFEKSTVEHGIEIDTADANGALCTMLSADQETEDDVLSQMFPVFSSETKCNQKTCTSRISTPPLEELALSIRELDLHGSSSQSDILELVDKWESKIKTSRNSSVKPDLLSVTCNKSSSCGNGVVFPVDEHMLEPPSDVNHSKDHNHSSISSINPCDNHTSSENILNNPPIDVDFGDSIANEFADSIDFDCEEEPITIGMPAKMYSPLYNLEIDQAEVVREESLSPVFDETPSQSVCVRKTDLHSTETYVDKRPYASVSPILNPIFLKPDSCSTPLLDVKKKLALSPAKQTRQASGDEQLLFDDDDSVLACLSMPMSSIADKHVLPVTIPSDSSQMTFTQALACVHENTMDFSTNGRKSLSLCEDKHHLAGLPSNKKIRPASSSFLASDCTSLLQNTSIHSGAKLKPTSRTSSFESSPLIPLVGQQSAIVPVEPQFDLGFDFSDDDFDDDAIIPPSPENASTQPFSQRHLIGYGADKNVDKITACVKDNIQNVTNMSLNSPQHVHTTKDSPVHSGTKAIQSIAEEPSFNLDSEMVSPPSSPSLLESRTMSPSILDFRTSSLSILDSRTAVVTPCSQKNLPSVPQICPVWDPDGETLDIHLQSQSSNPTELLVDDSSSDDDIIQIGRKKKALVITSPDTPDCKTGGIRNQMQEKEYIEFKTPVRPAPRAKNIQKKPIATLQPMKKSTSYSLHTSNDKDNDDEDFVTGFSRVATVRGVREETNYPRQKTFEQKRVQKKKGRKPPSDKCGFLEVEAELSGEDASSDESGSDLDEFDESFINDITTLSQQVQDPGDMHAVYMQSVRSPMMRGRTKLLYNHNVHLDVFSQRPQGYDEQESEYMQDSFCVDDDSPGSMTDEDEDSLLVKPRKRKVRKPKGKGTIISGKKRVMCLDGSSSDEETMNLKAADETCAVKFTALKSSHSHRLESSSSDGSIADVSRHHQQDVWNDGATATGLTQMSSLRTRCQNRIAAKEMNFRNHAALDTKQVTVRTSTVTNVNGKYEDSKIKSNTHKQLHADHVKPSDVTGIKKLESSKSAEVSAVPEFSLGLLDDFTDDEDEDDEDICSEDLFKGVVPMDTKVCQMTSDDQPPLPIGSQSLFSNVSYSKQSRPISHFSLAVPSVTTTCMDKEERLRLCKRKQQLFKQKTTGATSPKAVALPHSNTSPSNITSFVRPVATASDISNKTVPTKVSPSRTVKKIVLIDSREISGAQDLVSAMRFEHGLQTVVRSLGTCDYIVSNRMALERKVWSAFANGTNHTKFVSRMRYLCEQYDRPCLLVERDRLKSGEKEPRPGMRTKYVDNLLACLAQSHIKVLFSESQSESASLIAELVEQEARKGMTITAPVELSTHQEQVLKVYLSLPKLSHIHGLNLLAKFKTIQELIKSPVGVIEKKGCLPRNKAEEIYKFFHHCYDAQMVSFHK